MCVCVCECVCMYVYVHSESNRHSELHSIEGEGCGDLLEIGRAVSRPSVPSLAFPLSSLFPVTASAPRSSVLIIGTVALFLARRLLLSPRESVIDSPALASGPPIVASRPPIVASGSSVVASGPPVVASRASVVCTAAAATSSSGLAMTAVFVSASARRPRQVLVAARRSIVSVAPTSVGSVVQLLG